MERLLDEERSFWERRLCAEEIDEHHDFRYGHDDEERESDVLCEARENDGLVVHHVQHVVREAENDEDSWNDEPVPGKE